MSKLCKIMMCLVLLVGMGMSSPKNHVIKFYLDPALAADMEFVKAVLPDYVEDINTILVKNTNRRLIFDPETDIILTNKKPQTDYASLPLPEEGFEIWAHAVLSDYPYSFGGYGGLDVSGAGVLAGLKWARIYDPDQLVQSELKDYWVQINNMLHELAHVFGAGIGEYYKLARVWDTTEELPLLGIDVLDADDLFWSNKKDFMMDPLLRNAVQDGVNSRQALLDYVRYSDLTATLISGNYRNGAPSVDLENIIVRVVNQGGKPIADARVKVWNVVGNAPFNTQLTAESVTDERGEISFAWGGSGNPHNNYEFLRLIKVYKDGFISSAKYVSIYDADIAKLVNGQDTLTIVIEMNYSTYLPMIMCELRLDIGKIIV